MLRKANGRPIVSDSQPQNRRPAPLKAPITLTIIEAVRAPTPVNCWARGEATEIKAAPAVTFKARMSQRTYQRGRRNASARVYSRVVRMACWRSEGVQPAGA